MNLERVVSLAALFVCAMTCLILAGNKALYASGAWVAGLLFDRIIWAPEIQKGLEIENESDE